jgi:hypothetical protein
VAAEQSAPTSAGPRMPRASAPARSGSFRTAAAPMIGVARRNAKRAASLFERPTSKLPPIVIPEREMPGISAAACSEPTMVASRQLTWRAMRVSSSSAVSGARRRSASAPKSSRPLRNRKIAADCAEAKTLRSLCSRSKPRIPAGMVPTTSSQPSFASVSSGAMPRSRSERPRPLTMRAQSRRKKNSSTSAVARCVATRNVMKNLSF